MSTTLMAFSSRRSLFSRSFSLAAFLLSLVLLLDSSFITAAFSQAQADAATKRRVVARTAPVYPAIARTLSLEGIVRLEAVVSPDGCVKTVGVKGGHPVLAQAAVSAVLQWRWERAPAESREPIEVKFARD
ncbi:MAG: energy transducer TonB [Terriglobales bacterium]